MKTCSKCGTSWDEVGTPNYCPTCLQSLVSNEDQIRKACPYLNGDDRLGAWLQGYRYAEQERKADATLLARCAELESIAASAHSRLSTAHASLERLRVVARNYLQRGTNNTAEILRAELGKE